MVFGKAYSYYAISLDRINFIDVATSRAATGEDRNVLYTGLNIILMVDCNQKPRTIMFQKSNDFRVWTNPVEILKPDSQDGSNTEFYHLSGNKDFSRIFRFA